MEEEDKKLMQRSKTDLRTFIGRPQPADILMKFDQDDLYLSSKSKPSPGTIALRVGNRDPGMKGKS